jgi:hypothetical protein
MSKVGELGGADVGGIPMTRELAYERSQNGNISFLIGNKNIAD